MLFLTREILIALGACAVIALIFALNIPRYTDRIEQFGDIMRRFKYRRLVPWVDRIPIPANVMTGSRPLFIVASLYSFHHSWPIAALVLFTIGWLTDYFDGIRAYAEQQRRGGRPTRYGKYFDPAMDMLCFLMMGFDLRGSYPPIVISTFLWVAIVARLGLFGVLFCGRLLFRRWRDRVRSYLLEKTLTGEIKAAFIAVSFGLVLLQAVAPVGLVWAHRFLAAAIISEVMALCYLTWRASRRIFGPPQLEVVQSLDSTGTR